MIEMCGIHSVLVFLLCFKSVEPELKIPLQFPESSTIGVSSAEALTSQCTLLTSKLWIIVNTIEFIRYSARLRFHWVIGKMCLCLTISKRIITARLWRAISIQDFIIAYVQWVISFQGIDDSFIYFFLSYSITAGYKKFGIQSIANQTQLGDANEFLQNYWKQTERVFSLLFLRTLVTKCKLYAFFRS